MDIECGGFTFVSNFDSGNLARVELVPKKQNVNPAPGKNSPAEESPDFEFNIWTKPDCGGTEFENSNRTWFHFGIKGGAPFVLVKLNIVNLNRQSKMYSQGMAPVFRMVPGRNHWDRIKEKPSYTVEDDVFILSFKYRTLENTRGTTYFAFTYPYSYVELQNMLNSIDARFKTPSGEPRLPTVLDDIYYHRESVCYSLEGRSVDLITVTSYHGICSDREPRLKHLFPVSDVPRPFRFNGKKVVFVSARVHPGESPSSFVLNGLLNLLLSRDDPVAILLRKTYVFKLIPMLNPDGVSQGHYRTDTRGVNLNRMYLDPVLELHPSVFAARSLIRYYHHGCEMEEPTMNSDDVNCDNVGAGDRELGDGIINVSSLESLISETQDARISPEDAIQKSDRTHSLENKVSDLSLDEKDKSVADTSTSPINIIETSVENNNVTLLPVVSDEKKDVFATIHETLLSVLGNGNASNSTISVLAEDLPNKPLILNSIPSVIEVSTLPLYGFNEDENHVENSLSSSLENCAPDSVPSICKKVSSADHSIGSSSGGASADLNSEDEVQDKEPPDQMDEIPCYDLNCNKPVEVSNCASPAKNVETPREESGLFLYVDLHGHASKKGIFMYGNYFEDPDDSTECMLLPKIMSLNSQNFHFTACNFTERNMYLRDRRDGMSREGSGRVAVLKTTGLVRSYTLECNYNTGRLVNLLPPCVKDNKNVTPAQLMVPPKYTPQVFEEIGRALGVSILDLTGSNPFSRIPHSEFHSLSGIRDWLRMNCLPTEQTYFHRMVQGPKQVKRQPCGGSQVGGMAGMPVGVPPRPMRPSSSKNRNKRDSNLARSRRLAPLVSKSSESKVSSVKVSSNILSSNSAEDSERKENLSGFQVGSSSCVKVDKVFTEPKENIGPCSSQRCPGTSKKLKSVQSCNSGVLKQVLAVRSKCAAIGALAGSSKVSKSGIAPGRMQKITTTLGNMAVPKKGNQVTSPANIRTAKFRRPSITRLPPGPEQEDCLCLGTKSVSECSLSKLARKGHSQGDIATVKSSSSVDKIRCIKEEQKVLSDQTVVKQGPKRLKISSFKAENPPLSEVPYKSEGVLRKVKLKDIYTMKVVKDKKLINYDTDLKDVNLGNKPGSPTLSQEDDILWDSVQNPEDIQLDTAYQNSQKVGGKSTRKKQSLQNPKSVTPVTRSSMSENSQGTGSKVKSSTKSEKQGKGKVPHLSPIKTLQKKKSTDSSRKRGKVSLRNLATSVGRLRSPSSETIPSVQLEKKRKKFKSKYP